MLDNETAALPGGRSSLNQVETECSSPPPDLQASARNAKIARALRIRIQALLHERAEKARLALNIERWARAEQQLILDEILFDNITLKRLRSAVRRLEFQGEVAS
jgi:hypothetical protein